MSNDFYEASGVPATRSAGSSSPMRAEFNDIELGFDEMPVLTGNANKPVVINAGATALTTVAQLPPAQGGTGAGVLTQGSVVFAGALGIYSQNNSNFFWDNTGIGLGIGSASLNGYNLRISAPIGGVGSAVGVSVNGEVQTTATTSPASYASQPTFNATPFAIANFTHYSASQGAIGGATITNQYGFLAASNIASGTLVAGFRGDITSGTGKWNFYAVGTALNAFTGNTRFGSVVAPTVMVDITGDLIASGQATIAATAPVSAIATTKLWITGDITLRDGNRGFLGNLYYDGAWKYVAGGSTGAALKVGVDTTTAIQFLAAPNNAGGAGAAATPATAASITSAGVFNITAAVITGATITNPTFTNPPTIPSLSANNVLFMSASNVISQDGNFQYDPATNRLGVGTTVLPTLANLHVQGNTAAGSVADVALIANIASATAGHGARLYLAGSSGPSRAVYIEGVNTTGASQAHAMVFGTSDAGASPVERMRITNNGEVIVLGSSRFGGATTPLAIVDITDAIGVAAITATGTGLNVTTTYSGNATPSSVIPVQFLCTVSGANALTLHRGVQVYTLNSQTSTKANSTALYALASHNGTGITTAMSAARFQMSIGSGASAGSVTTGYTLHLDALSLSATATFGSTIALAISNHGNSTRVTSFAIGIDIASFTATSVGAVTYGIRNAMSAGTDRWGYYGSGAAQNAFVGNTRIGSVVAPTVALDVTGSVNVSGNAVIVGNLNLGATSNIGWSLRASIVSPVDAAIILYNDAQTIGARLSATADGAMSVLTVAGAGGAVTAATYNATTSIVARSTSAIGAAATAQYFIQGSNAATKVGLWFSTGTPNAVVTAASGSLYLRTDGAANTRLYINTSAGSGTTWAAVTTP